MIWLYYKDFFCRLQTVAKKEDNTKMCYLLFLLVPKVGLEPTPSNLDRILSPTRLPIPPLRHKYSAVFRLHDLFYNKQKKFASIFFICWKNF